MPAARSGTAAAGDDVGLDLGALQPCKRLLPLQVVPAAAIAVAGYRWVATDGWPPEVVRSQARASC